MLPLSTARAWLVVHYPLEQGLKQQNLDALNMITDLVVHYPLEQGLKPEKKDTFRVVVVLVVHYPLEQGLKPLLTKQGGFGVRGS